MKDNLALNNYGYEYGKRSINNYKYWIAPVVNNERYGVVLIDGKIVDLEEYKQAKKEGVTYSNKQQKVLTWWTEYSPYKNHTGIIADGAIRSGKSASLSLSYVIWSMSKFKDMNFGICGKTIGSLKRNVIKPLIKMLEGSIYTVQERYGENMIVIKCKINGKVVKNDYYLFGGQDESSQKLVQGVTLAGCLFDEVALMPHSFVNQATARCSVRNSKLWFNCNPEGPFHFFKKEWIDKSQEKKILYLHFTMEDNPSLGEEIKERYRQMYTGVFRRRFINGEWAMASGVIYSMYDEDVNIVKTPDNIGFWDRLYVSCDYGTMNPCTFGLFGIKGGWVHQIRSYYYDGRTTQVQKTDGEYAEDMVQFLGKDKEFVKEIIVDPSAASFITELRKKKYGLPVVIKANNDVLSGIRTTQNFVKFGLFTMDASCKEDRREFTLYSWDESKAKQGIDAPIKEDDHCMDKIRYLIYTKLGKNTFVEYDEKVYNKGRESNPYKDVLRRSKGVV